MSAGRAKNSDHLSLYETARTPPILTGHLHKLGGAQLRSLIEVSYTVNMRERQSATACLVDKSIRHISMPISSLQALSENSGCVSGKKCDLLLWGSHGGLPVGDFVKNWRNRFFTVHAKPVPILAYYRDADKQQEPTQVLLLQGAKVEVCAPSNAPLLPKWMTPTMSS